MPALPNRPVPRPVGHRAVSPPAPQWFRVAMRIKVYNRGEEGTKEVEGQRLGVLLLHTGFSNTDWGKQSLTCLPSGLRITFVATEADARAIAEYLVKGGFSQALGQPTDAAIVKALPKWAIDWLVACQAEGKWVPPPTLPPQTTRR